MKTSCWQKQLICAAEAVDELHWKRVEVIDAQAPKLVMLPIPRHSDVPSVIGVVGVNKLNTVVAIESY